MYTARKITNKILDAIAEGTLTAQQVVDGCLQFMSEQQVADMAHAEEFFTYEDDGIELDDEDCPQVIPDDEDDLLEDTDPDGFYNAYQQALDGEEPLPPVYTDRDN